MGLMARKYARIKVTMWGDQDYRNLTRAAQHLYLLLVTSPKMTLCGVTDWRPKRLASLTAGLDEQDITDAASELLEHGYIVLDEDSEEVLIRSFLRHDETIKTPNIAAAMAKDYAGVTSRLLQGVIVHEMHRLMDDEPDWKGWTSVRGVMSNPSINPSTLKASHPNPSPKVSPKVSEDVSHIPLPSTSNQQPAAPAQNADAAEHGRAAKIVGAWRDGCKNLPPRKVQGQIRYEVQNLLDDGIAPDAIAAGLARWQQRGNLGPSLLANLVHEVGNEEDAADDGPKLVLNEHMPRMEPTW